MEWVSPSILQGDTLDELWENIQEAVAVHFDDDPVDIQLRLALDLL